MNINVDHPINSLDACPLSFSKALGGTFAGVLINNKTQVKGLAIEVREIGRASCRERV